MNKQLDEILEDFYDGDIRQSDMGKAKQAIIAHTNAEIAKVLDRLESKSTPADTSPITRIKYIEIPLSVLESERAKLKDAK